MSIELVDKIDQGKTGKRYQKVGLNDLFLVDEEAAAKRAANGDDLSVSSMRSTATTDDYIGLELESVMQHRIQRKKTSKLLLVAIAISLIIGSIVYFNRSKTQTSNAAGGPAGDDDGRFPIIDESEVKPGGSNVDEDVEEEDKEIEDLAESLWPTKSPAPEFDICKPHVHFKHDRHIFHVLDITIVPESMTDDSYEWEYTFTGMAISEDASIIAAGLADFSTSMEKFAVGMVRVFAFDCHHHKYMQLGQDLLGTQDAEEFGSSIVSSKDGTVMAIAAPQSGVEKANGYVAVYYLDSNVWKPLGHRIEDLDDSEDYYNLGTAIAVSDDGETLACMGVISSQKFVTRVFFYDYNQEKWIRKGGDLTIEVSDDATSNSWGFEPVVSLGSDGDKLGLLDPQFGLLTFTFDFEKDTWIKADTAKMTTFGKDAYYVTAVDIDDSSNLVAFSAYSSTLSQVAKVVDFSNDTETELFKTSFNDYEVGLTVKVSDDGTVAAVLASQIDMDDNSFWDYDDVGALTVVSVNDKGSWDIIGAGGDCENFGVPGNFIALSGAGDVAAIGTDSVISLYGIQLNHKKVNHTSASSDSTSTPTLIPEASESNETFTIFDVCPPYPDGKTSHHVGDIEDLPKQEDQHTLSLALSGNSSVVAVGIDSWDEEHRGMARVFGWNCATGAFEQLGQDIYGQLDEDGFGQSVDLSEDGSTLVVGANQPVPGKPGYVDVYHLDHKEGWVLEKRIETVKDGVEDIGREVRISSDSSTIAIMGSIIDTTDSEYAWRSSFIRIMEKVDGKWKEKGDDLTDSISYDSYGTSVKISFAADGSTLGVVGSYDTFMAKIYDFDKGKSNWTETIVPPLKKSGDDDDEGDQLDEDLDSYFDGYDIAMSDDGNEFAVAGKQWSENYVVARVLQRDVDGHGSWTMSDDAIQYDGDYALNSISMSATANVVAAGVNWADDSETEQGAFYVSVADDSDSGWSKLGTVDGENEKDKLGSRVAVSSDGRFVAGSSRKGYVSFFKTSVTV